jgi:hypothetical protein
MSRRPQAEFSFRYPCHLPAWPAATCPFPSCTSATAVRQFAPICRQCPDTSVSMCSTTNMQCMCMC